MRKVVQEEEEGAEDPDRVYLDLAEEEENNEQRKAMRGRGRGRGKGRGKGKVAKSQEKGENKGPKTSRKRVPSDDHVVEEAEKVEEVAADETTSRPPISKKRGILRASSGLSEKSKSSGLKKGKSTWKLAESPKDMHAEPGEGPVPGIGEKSLRANVSAEKPKCRRKTKKHSKVETVSSGPGVFEPAANVNSKKKEDPGKKSAKDRYLPMHA